MSNEVSAIKIIDADGYEVKSHPAKNRDMHFKIQTRKISGFFQRLRKYSLWFMMSAFFLSCWVQIGDQPLLLFNLQAQKFHVFGMTFWPQDFFLLAVLLIISAFGLFFITTIFGRLWCGYTCPQTAWTFVFMWLEEHIEGSRNQRIKMDNAPMSVNKLAKRMAKHMSWLGFAFITGFTFIAYFYPARDLLAEMLAGSFSSMQLPLWVLFFTLATYINAGWMREAVCMHICPYARFQSVMFNHDTLVVAYDEKRGEPRGKDNKTDGHCVDCQLCVQVCPTGIDIRDGLQYQCIGCALCIDACDSIMEKLGAPKGLVRYASEAELVDGNKKHTINMRSMGYGTLLVLAIAGFAYNLWNRPLLDFHILRERGNLFQELGNGEIKNTYTLKVANKTQVQQHFTLSMSGLEGRILGADHLIAPAGDMLDLDFTVYVFKEKLKTANVDVQFSIQSMGEQPLSAVVDNKFMGPR
ncbi:MAG: cytochrome c oxidase accessory protein CcoG [Pseudomonadales bacterium]|nr:cytochrome c oxidase accessory protein CcoG [Pseudomonadales bacterium]